MSDKIKILEYQEGLITPLNLNLEKCSGLRMITPIILQGLTATPIIRESFSTFLNIQIIVLLVCPHVVGYKYGVQHIILHSSALNRALLSCHTVFLQKA